MKDSYVQALTLLQRESSNIESSELSSELSLLLLDNEEVIQSGYSL